MCHTRRFDHLYGYIHRLFGVVFGFVLILSLFDPFLPEVVVDGELFRRKLRLVDRRYNLPRYNLVYTPCFVI